MKYILLLVTVSLVLFGCQEAVQYGEPNITFGQAFKHCLTDKLYVNLIVVASIIFLGSSFWIYKNYQKVQTTTTTHFVVGLVSLGLLLFAIFALPATMAANTTVVQASQGHYIGW